MGQGGIRRQAIVIIMVEGKKDGPLPNNGAVPEFVIRGDQHPGGRVEDNDGRLGRTSGEGF